MEQEIGLDGGFALGLCDLLSKELGLIASEGALEANAAIAEACEASAQHGSTARNIA